MKSEHYTMIQAIRKAERKHAGFTKRLTDYFSALNVPTDIFGLAKWLLDNGYRPFDIAY